MQGKREVATAGSGQTFVIYIFNFKCCGTRIGGVLAGNDLFDLNRFYCGIAGSFVVERHNCMAAKGVTLRQAPILRGA